ncbi:uncharacterized protein LOC125950095 [Anopheles darlingi]|uniref:uncharacterized protein LOC125950095 n=1 Tax=Anopheles darlingi TaxID=43151 RepID=UPI0021000CB2|nr:uncharacterized protein LOC125950095 [Anopheles darlingi]
MASKSSKINFSEVLPEDEKIISRNLAWRKIVERYSKAGSGDDDEGILISDLVQHDLASDDVLSDESSASEVSEDDTSYSDSSDDDFEENKQQLAVAVKARTNQWKESGLIKLFEDNFTLGTKEALNWVQQCKAGQGKAIEREQETRFTEIDGDKTLDVSCKRNVSVLNQNGTQKFASINNSNVEMKHGTGKRIIFQQTERTLTTIFDVTACSTMDLSLPPSFLSFSNMSAKNIPSILSIQNLSTSKPKPSRKVIFKPPKPPKKCYRKEPNDHSQQRTVTIKEIPAKQVANKQTEPIIISSADSDSGKSDSLSPEKVGKPLKQKQVTFKLLESPEHAPNDRSQQNKEKAPANPSKQVTKTHTKATAICSTESVNNELPGDTIKPFNQKQINVSKPKPTASCDGSQKQNTYNTRTSKQNITAIKGNFGVKCDSSIKPKIKPQKKPTDSCSDSTVSLGVLVKPKEQSIAPSVPPKLKQQVSARSDESRMQSKGETDTVMLRRNYKAEKSSTESKPTGKSQIAAPTETKSGNDNQRYYMTETMKTQLKIGGRFRYQLQGMVIYRPKQINHDAPATERIRITREHLDLGGIADEKRRQKFNNFLYNIHPNSKIVYYMSEDEDEPEAEDNDAEDSESEDEDDPILTFRPKVCVFEIPYEKPSL